MKRPYVLLLSFSLIFSAFFSGVIAAPMISNVFVTNFPLDSKGNLRTSGNVNVTVNQLLPSKQIVLFQGDLIGFGYGVNQTELFAGGNGDSFNVSRTYFNHNNDQISITQIFRILTNATVSIQTLFGSPACCSVAGPLVQVYPPFYIVNIYLALAPGLSTVQYQFRLGGSAHGRIDLL